MPARDRDDSVGGPRVASIAVRDAESDDLLGVLAIYNEVIAFSTAVFSEHAVTLEERERWLAGRREQGYPVLVAADASGVVGFGSFGDFRAWPGTATPSSTPCTCAPTAAAKASGPRSCRR